MKVVNNDNAPMEEREDSWYIYTAYGIEDRPRTPPRMRELGKVNKQKLVYKKAAHG